MQAILTLLVIMTVIAGTSPGPAPPPTMDVAGTGALDEAAAGEAAGGTVSGAAGGTVGGAPTSIAVAAEDDAAETVHGASASVVALLDALEADGKTLTTLTARVLYEVEDALLEERVIRKGDLIYQIDQADGSRRFGLLFTERIVPPRKRESRRSYIFTDRWLVEVDYDAKLFVKRELVPPGSTFDPFKLGEGPIPLPIGQRRDDVLERFVVTEIAPPAAGPLRRLDRDLVRGLRLVPRPGARGVDDVRHMDLFFDRERLVPVGVEVIETNDDRKTARLDDVRRNPPLGEGAMERLGVEVPEGDWRVDVRRLERGSE